ncbi:MAG: hypothetical protein KAS70_03405 [Planctomycetes bacterium]|nr:hypothetical protein [Planctomycetota bacterium]
MKKYVLGVFVLSLLVFSFITLQAQEDPARTLPDVYRLHPVVNAGSKFVVEEEYNWDGNIVITVNKKSQKFPFKTLIQHQYSEEILESMPGLKTKRRYTLSRKKTDLPNEGVVTKPISFNNKTLLLAIKNGRVKILENLSKKESDVLTRDLPLLSWTGDFNAVLPGKPIAVGDSWQIDSDFFARVALKDDYRKELCEASGQGTLDEIVKYDGKKCAKISLEITVNKEVDAKKQAASAFNIKLAGFCLFSLKDGYITKLELTGPFKVLNKQNSKNDGIVETRDSQIVLSIKISSKLEK